MLTDYGTSLSGTDSNSSKVWAALNTDAIDSWATLETFFDNLTDLSVFNEPVAIISFASKPLAAPVLIDLETVAYWVYFLTHLLLLLFFFLVCL